MGLAVGPDLATLLPEGCARFGVPGAQLGLLREGTRTVTCAGVRSAGEPEAVDAAPPYHAGPLAKALGATLGPDAAGRGEVALDVGGGDQAAGAWRDTPRALMA